MHYQRFIAMALAADRLDAIAHPDKFHVSNRIWAYNRIALYGNMYELTEALCHNYWYVLRRSCLSGTRSWEEQPTDIG